MTDIIELGQRGIESFMIGDYLKISRIDKVSNIRRHPRKKFKKGELFRMQYREKKTKYDTNETIHTAEEYKRGGNNSGCYVWLNNIRNN